MTGKIRPSVFLIKSPTGQYQKWDLRNTSRETTIPAVLHRRRLGWRNARPLRALHDHEDWGSDLCTHQQARHPALVTPAAREGRSGENTSPGLRGGPASKERVESVDGHREPLLASPLVHRYAEQQTQMHTHSDRETHVNL